MALYRIYRLNIANRMNTRSVVDRKSDDTALKWAGQTFGITCCAEIRNSARRVGELRRSLGWFDAAQSRLKGIAFTVAAMTHALDTHVQFGQQRKKEERLPCSSKLTLSAR
jgi:hypothetical protein